jgi:cell division septation protein DedD
MEFKFSNESDHSQQKVPDDKKNQSALVLLLLILVGGFMYIYFFTGLLKPQEAQKAAESPAAAPKIVKMPLPPSGGEVAKPNEKAVATNETPKAVAPAVVASAVPAATPDAAPVAPAAPAKPAPAAVTAPAVKAVPPPPVPKPKEEIKKSAAVKPAEKAHLPAIAPEKKAAAAAPKIEAKKPVAADKKGAPVKEALKKPAANGTPKARVDVSTKPAEGGSWTIVVGSYVLEEALAADLGRVRKSGFEPIVKPGSRKKTAMNRLFVSDFNDRVSAQSTLEKLKQLTSDAFVIEQGGKFAVYAGSYLQGGAANSEKERLKAAGFKTTVNHMDIFIPTQTLSVGPFASKKAADAARGKLKNAGLKATISQP